MSPERGFLRSDQGADNPDLPDNWRNGKHLPHWDGKYIPQSLTFRLYDAVPDSVIQKWKREYEQEPDETRKKELYWKIQKYMDSGHGQCWLGIPDIADLTQNALLHFDEERYVLHAWVIMPNHVHTLLSIIGDHTLSDIMHSLCSYTANKANDMLNRSGTFWGDDYHDRFIRNKKHFGNAVRYIELNPVNASLCDKPEEWKWSSARFKSKGVF